MSLVDWTILEGWKGKLERDMCPKSENRGVNRIAALFTVKIFAAHKA